ncbi:trypsin-like serine protease [Myxococcota bacterium]|nr:trypsin-like serine protease [Myxococcota bacterium]
MTLQRPIPSPRVLSPRSHRAPAARGLLALSALVGAPLAAGCADTAPATPTPAPTAAVAESGIRNGTREPEAVALTEGQILALGWLFPTGDPAANFCTATLINPSTVITASHCTQGNSARDIGFGVGLYPNDPVATFRAAGIFEHPQLDLAVITLAENAIDRVPELSPIPANTEDPSPLEGTEVQVGGFGETYDRSRFGRYFATVLLDRVRADELQVDGRGIQGLCFGDSGGPVIGVLGQGPVVMGVESWGDQSCVDVDHLTRTDVAAPFIAPILGGDIPEDPCAGLDYLGRCNGQTAEWCEGSTFRQLDCVAEGGHCAYVDDRVGWYCVEGPPDPTADAATEPEPTRDAAVEPPVERDQGVTGGAEVPPSGGATPPAGGSDGPFPQGGGLFPEPEGGTMAPTADAALATADGGVDAPDQSSGGAGGGCAVAPGRTPSAGLALGVLALLAPLAAGRRRRRCC